MTSQTAKRAPRLAPVTLKNDPPAKWSDLCALLALRPIRNEREYRRAQKVMNTLAILETRTSDQEDYLCVLTMLYGSYEDLHHSLPHSGMAPLQALQQLMDLHGMNGSDLGRLLGCREMGCMIMKGRRALSKANVLKLSSHFKVNPRVFLYDEEMRSDKTAVRRASSMLAKKSRPAILGREAPAAAF